MKKLVFGKKLSRGRSSREMLFVSLVEGLIGNGKIVTTKAKAKAVAGFADKLVTLAKKGTLSSKRLILKKLKNSKLSSKLWQDIAKLFEDRNGGYTRIVPLVSRKGDLAKMVRLEWTSKKKDENLSTKTKRN